MLTNADLKYLQDTEHFGGFVLGDRTLPLLAEALRDGDRESLAAFLSESFEGRQTLGLLVHESRTLLAKQHDSVSGVQRC